jgi:hypothetical protein
MAFKQNCILKLYTCLKLGTVSRRKRPTLKHATKKNANLQYLFAAAAPFKELLSKAHGAP